MSYFNYATIIILCVFNSISVCKAEIEKIAIPSEKGLELYWWPKVNPPSGFVYDSNASFHFATKMFIQKGSTFKNSETVIYAKAMYKPKMPEIKTLKQLIDEDVNHFRSKDSTINIDSFPSLNDGDGNNLTVFTFSPPKEGNWEAVTYSEEDDFYLLFTISSLNKKEFEKSFPKYKEMLLKYHKKP